MSACWLFIHKLFPPKWQGGWRHWPIVQVKSHTSFGAIRREQIIWVLWMAHKMSISCHKINCCLSEHPISPAIFNEEFGEYLQGVILSKEPLLITGDFNFHFDDCSDKDAAKIKDLLLEFGLQQHVNVPTDRDGHTLDLFITRMSDNTTLDEPVASYYISDHIFVVCQLSTQKPATVMETITYRKYKQIDI